MRSAYLELVCAHMFLCGGAIAHGCQASGTPRDQQGSTGQQLRHQAYAWAHVAQIWTECHTGTSCQGGRHWECCLRDGENGRDKTSYSRASSAFRKRFGANVTGTNQYCGLFLLEKCYYSKH